MAGHAQLKRRDGMLEDTNWLDGAQIISDAFDASHKSKHTVVVVVVDIESLAVSWVVYERPTS